MLPRSRPLPLQHMSTIEWLKVKLTQRGFGYRYICGSMPLKQRSKVRAPRRAGCGLAGGRAALAAG